MCRRKYLLYYFGEEYDDTQCNGMCDNHRFPKKKFDAQDDFKLIFQTVIESAQRFKSQQIVNTLRGKLTSHLKTFSANQMSTWMEGKDQSEAHWDNVVRQAVVLGYLEKEIETYGLLKLSDSGRKFLEKPFEVLIPENTDYNLISGDGRALGKQSSGAELDPLLFGILKDLTKKVAKSKGVPPYAVFQEPSLQEMSTSYPCTLDELKNISGVGEGKAKKFGKDFVAAIAKYVEENEIERPMDMVVKTVANKSVLKVYIITSTDKKIPLNDIAKAKGLSMDELIKEMEMIVFSGTRLNIDYYLEDILDEDSIEEIYDHFMDEAEEGTLEEAVQEFGADYSEEEIRLVRMKFMSEVAN
jgi:ATP-dependent DNA helicase RecQ